MLTHMRYLKAGPTQKLLVWVQLCYYYYCCCTVCTALLFSYSAIFIAASVRN